MPNCRNCNSYFSTKIRIGNKTHNVQSRKFCLVCSPFKKHNTRKALKNLNATEIVCKECNKSYIYNRKKGHRLTICNSCSVAARRRIIKNKAVVYSGGSCKICGYNKCLRALDFHHINKDHKDFEIGKFLYRKWEIIKQELDKCVLLCSNCHMEIHDGIIEESILV